MRCRLARFIGNLAGLGLGALGLCDRGCDAFFRIGLAQSRACSDLLRQVCLIGRRKCLLLKSSRKNARGLGPY